MGCGPVWNGTDECGSGEVSKNQSRLWLNVTGTAQQRAVSVSMPKLACVSHVMRHIEGKGGGSEMASGCE